MIASGIYRNVLDSKKVRNNFKIGGKWFGKTKLTANDLAEYTEIGMVAFGDLFDPNKIIKITSLEIGDNIKAIGISAFQNNTISSLTLGRNVRSIAPKAFSNNQLTSLVIGNGTTYIGDGAFEKNKLTSVIMGKNVEEIGVGLLFY